jgi:hypothetical protein
MESAEYPEDEIKKIFRQCFDQTLKGAEECGTKPDQFLVAISSPLLDWDLRARFHSLDKNTIESLFHRYELVDQSNKKKDGGRDSMITQPFTIDITAIQSKGKKQPKKKHPGGNGKKRLRPQFQNVNVNALIEINNSDQFCLFRASEMSRAKKRLNDQEFRHYNRAGNKQQQRDFFEMINNIEIDQNHQKYAIEDYGQQIQNYYESQWPSTYKLFAFKSSGELKPFWKSDTTNWTTPVVVYYQEEEQHYDAVANTGHLFGVPDAKGHLRGKYCFVVRFKNIKFRTIQSFSAKSLT